MEQKTPKGKIVKTSHSFCSIYTGDDAGVFVGVLEGVALFRGNGLLVGVAVGVKGIMALEDILGVIVTVEVIVGVLVGVRIIMLVEETLGVIVGVTVIVGVGVGVSIKHGPTLLKSTNSTPDGTIVGVLPLQAQKL